MKKLNKKQSVIILISIITIIVLIGISIGLNVIKINIANNNYKSANSELNNGNLLPEYIKKGITLGGVTGTLEELDTFDATATEEDILWGKTAYVKGKKITGTKVLTVKKGKESQKIFKENTTLLDDYGNNVKVPAGFKIASDSATNVTDDVVIEDANANGTNTSTEGSQFVWVPVGNVITDSNGSTVSIDLGRYIFDDTGKETLVQKAAEYASETQLRDNYNESTIGGYYQELLKDKATSNRKAKNISDFIQKTTNSGGYYIGRYEAGDSNATDNARNADSNDDNPMVCKKGVYPYNFITQVQASELCQNMYSNKAFQSDLVNSYAWDTAIIFIQKFSQNKNYSNKEIVQNDIVKCGEIYSGEETDVECNIYDMAKTPGEWTTETFFDSESNGYTVRGSVFMNNYHLPSGRDVSLDDNTNLVYLTCRTILYL